MHRFGLTLLVGILGISAELNARDFYVNNMSGDDRLDGSSPEVQSGAIGPMRSIGRALKAVKPGDRIVLAKNDEPYRESIALQGIRHSGTIIREQKQSAAEGSFDATTEIVPFQIVGNQAVIDGTVPVGDDGWEHVEGNIFRFQPEYSASQILYRDGKPLNRVGIKGVEELKNLQPLDWTLYRGHIYFHVEKDQLPQGYGLRCCGSKVGITLYDIQHVELLDLTVQGFAIDGINAHDNVYHTKIVGATLRGNGRSGVHAGGSSKIEVEASLVGNNGTSQIHATDYAKVNVANSDVIDAAPIAPGTHTEGKATVDGVQ